ncbi:hypothetical protein FRC00_012770, partial [Tulasnella sp. 408]
CFASSAKDDRKHIGPAQSEIWTICQDGTLDAFWTKDDQTRHLLEAAMDPSDNEPGLLPDFTGYNERRPGLWNRVVGRFDSWVGICANGQNRAYPSFRGGSGSECEEFISSVRKAAFNVGKVNDDGWQAGYASACLSGEALRFYEDLPENTQTSWKLVRAALLSKYPASSK